MGQAKTARQAGDRNRVIEITGAFAKRCARQRSKAQPAVLGLNCAHGSVASTAADGSSGFRVAVQVFYLLDRLASTGPASQRSPPSPTSRRSAERRRSRSSGVAPERSSTPQVVDPLCETLEAEPLTAQHVAHSD